MRKITWPARGPGLVRPAPSAEAPLCLDLADWGCWPLLQKECGGCGDSAVRIMCIAVNCCTKAAAAPCASSRRPDRAQGCCCQFADSQLVCGVAVAPARSHMTAGDAWPPFNRVRFTSEPGVDPNRIGPCIAPSLFTPSTTVHHCMFTATASSLGQHPHRAATRAPGTAAERCSGGQHAQRAEMQ